MRLTQYCAATTILLQCTRGAYIAAVSLRKASGDSKDYTMLLTNFIRLLRRWRRYNKSLRELSRLGDRELADIGITRGDIPMVAWEAAQSA
jgi:uncharacterized protein YjiS (DUF1127 family)